MSEAENDTIRLQGLALGYPGRTLFENVDLSFGRGELTALIGRNGTGKARCCARLWDCYVLCGAVS